ncbi:semaphorin-4D-like [Erpetoichthys calabaricus]|uniref:semaphorin-4D-like n=1 Tax=Erpetoichthys calabaricus TaxID=27687 RepID=UPI0022348FAB|nr:semaphorin-4D-like [Erpetoichthys calabaricus]
MHNCLYGELYSGTESNFLGSQYVIYRSSSTNKMITYYAPAWLKEPRFVHADVIRESVNSANGDDDKIYFFFTEVNVELPQDLTKFFIPRIARVCKHDMGGRTVLQDRWTSFLKAKLVCWVPELNIVFDEVLDVLILKAPNWKDTVIYALFRSHWDYSMDSAVCKYKMSTVDEVFSRGTHMEEVIVLNMYQSWFRRQETFSSPRPGECINDNIRNNNIQSSKDLPSVILEFLKKSPMIHDSVLPVGNRPQMVFKNMNYTQIAVDQVRALDSRTYDIIFISTEDGNVHKTVVIDSKWHIIEEIQLLPNPEPIKELLLSSGQKKSLYAGSDERLVQSPVEFCEKHQSCVDCILARDPYCAWSTDASLCVNQIMHRNAGGLIQRLNGNFSVCPPVKHSVGYQNIVTQHGQYAALRLPCHLNSGLSRAMWMKNGVYLAPSPSKYEIVGDGDLLILNISQSDQGNYTCFLVQKVEIGDRKELVAAYTLNLIDRTDGAASSPFLYLFLLFLLLFLALLVYTCYPRCLPLLFPETINSSCYSGLAAEKRFDGSCW